MIVILSVVLADFFAKSVLKVIMSLSHCSSTSDARIPIVSDHLAQFFLRILMKLFVSKSSLTFAWSFGLSQTISSNIFHISS